MTAPRRSVILAGGGTGGHVFPLLAVAEAMVELAPSLRPVFVGTPRGMETRLVPERGFDLSLLDVLPMRGSGLGGFVRGGLRAVRTLPESARLLGQLGAVGVLSVGGYAAGPVSLAGWGKGLPVALLEPNSVIGLANRLIAPLVTRAYTAFELTEGAFAPSVVRPLGVPIRAGFTPVAYHRSLARPKVLVLGGSQGALALNQTLPRALSAVRRALPGLSVVHQCGAAHLEAVQAAYADLGSSEAGEPFAEVTAFIEDMPRAIAAADLVVSRSGASAVSEITAVGRASLLIPYPYASGNHQFYNALSLERAGAARCLPSLPSEESLAREIQSLLSAPGRMEQMAAAATAFGRPQAASMIARDFLDLLADARPAQAAPPQALGKPSSGAPLRFARES